jgi:dimethylaniline monooxygenase (N-oxide forming) / hypotaurine monooxygenase
MDERFPGASEYLVTSVIKKMQRDAFKIRPEWRLSPAPSLKHCPPMVSDSIVGALEAGTVQPVPGIKAFQEGKVVELQDATTITVDVVVWCTGYQLDFSVLDPAVDPSRNTTPAWTEAPGSKGKPLPRLYKNLFSLDYPDSLAVLGPAFFLQSAMPTYDLATMAIAQIWKGNFSLPPLQEMTAEVDEHHAWLATLAKGGTIMPGLIREQQWMAWANEAAGTGLRKNLGWGSAGWAFWYRDRALCGMLMDGVHTPFVYRLFDGRRKKWEGAREQILKANERVKSL